MDIEECQEMAVLCRTDLQIQELDYIKISIKLQDLSIKYWLLSLWVHKQT